MNRKSAISILLFAEVILLVLCMVIFNREMAATVESSFLAKYEMLPAEAEAFSANMDAKGVNNVVDKIRHLLKLSFGIGDA